MYSDKDEFSLDRTSWLINMLPNFSNDIIMNCVCVSPFRSLWYSTQGTTHMTSVVTVVCKSCNAQLLLNYSMSISSYCPKHSYCDRESFNSVPTLWVHTITSTLATPWNLLSAIGYFTVPVVLQSFFVGLSCSVWKSGSL